MSVQPLGGRRSGLVAILFLTAGLGLAICDIPAARAGGGPENVLLIIDPQSADSLHVGNYYKQARNIPDRNVIYMNPASGNYAGFADDQLEAIFGMLANRQIDDHVDYIVVTPVPVYRISAPGYINDDCFPVTHFSLSSVYTMAYLADAILASDEGDTSGMVATTPNQYYSSTNSALAFQNDTAWLGGNPDTSGAARRYFIGAMLGYTGNNGNSVEEILDMIDRSVAVDGTHPSGTFYFMKTDDVLRSSPRDPFFASIIAALASLGETGVQIEADLPIGMDDCLGILTGEDELPIDTADFTVLPGAYCDHLTSFAAYFDASNQTKLSRWIAKGASGSVGAVQEPCNYAGKFPHPRIQWFYAAGLSLGESIFRSMAYVPYQLLFYGDPLTQPFAYIPEVSVPDAPVLPVSGTVPLTPVATTASPGAAIATHDLLVDGIVMASIVDGQAFALDTTVLSDGEHDVRVVSTDDTAVETQGRWIGQITVDNLGRSAVLSVDPPAGDLSTVFAASVSAAGAAVAEIRLLHNNRVLAATQSPAADFDLLGSMLGAGPVRLIAEADFADGTQAQSAPFVIDVSNANPPGVVAGPAPIAYSYVKHVKAGKPFLLELTAVDTNDPQLSYAVLTGPSLGSAESLGGNVQLVRPNCNADGTDMLTFQASSGNGTSATATITLQYEFTPCTGTAPAIAFQFFTANRCSGQLGNFVATTTGDPAPSLQWYYNNQPIPGENEIVFQIPNIQVADSGLYYMRASNIFGQAQTTDMVVTVVDPVVVTEQPQSAVDCDGSAVMFEVTHDGGGAGYQWRRDGVELAGEESATLFIDPVTPADYGTYDVVIINTCGSVTSDPATLTAREPADINCDGGIDLFDHAEIFECLSGPSGGTPPGCEIADLTPDGSIDLHDYGAFQAAFPP